MGIGSEFDSKYLHTVSGTLSTARQLYADGVYFGSLSSKWCLSVGTDKFVGGYNCVYGGCRGSAGVP